MTDILWYNWEKNERASKQTEDDQLFPGPSVFDVEPPSELPIKTSFSRPSHRHIPEPAKPSASCPDPSSMLEFQSCRHLLAKEPPTTFVNRGALVRRGKFSPSQLYWACVQVISAGLDGLCKRATKTRRHCIGVSFGHALASTRGAGRSC